MDSDALVRMTIEASSSTELVILVDGHLDARAVPELRKLIDTANGTRSVVLRIDGLKTVDASGKTLLVNLRNAGCRIIGGSLYFRTLLERVDP